MWLANMFNLLNLLKQYSGDAEYQTDVSERQSAKFLRTFNLSQFWTILQRGIISLFVVIFSGGVKFITINPCSCSLTSFNLVPRLVYGGLAWHEVLKPPNLFFYVATSHGSSFFIIWLPMCYMYANPSIFKVSECLFFILLTRGQSYKTFTP